MAQVVTNENLVEFVTTGKVADFKPPSATPAAADATSGAASATNKTNGDEGAAALDKSKTNGSESPSQGRGADGKFQPAKKADATSAEIPDDAADLPERARKQVGKYFRLRKEAEEFATQEGRRALAAESRASAAEAELQRLKGGTKSEGPTSTVPADAEPKEEDFKTVGAFLKAYAKWEVRQAAQAAGAASAQAVTEQQAQEQASELAAAYEERQTKFQATTPDYEQVLEDCDAELSNVGMQYLVESETGPQLAYFLAKPENQHHIARLNKLSPARLLAELGKLEDKLEAAAKSTSNEPDPKAGAKPAAPAEPPRQVSKAPAPIAPLNSDAGSTPTHKDPQSMSFAELREYRKQEALRKSGGRP